MLALATKVVSDYGDLLKDLNGSLFGQPESTLPHSKAAIREAILTLYEEFGQEQPEVAQGLIHGFVYLAQFVPDADAELVAREQPLIQDAGPEDDLSGDAVKALQVINGIKLEMEAAMEEIQQLLAKQAASAPINDEPDDAPDQSS